jgi:hypothetical protein
MRKLILGMIGAAALLMGAPPVPANAQPVDPERVALAKTYLEISGQVITAKQLGDIVPAKLIELNPDLKEQITTASAGLIPRYDSYVQTIIDEAATAYAARFTGRELQSIVDFYKSLAGQKFASQTTAALQESFSAKWGGDDVRAGIAKSLAAQGITMKMPQKR